MKLRKSTLATLATTTSAAGIILGAALLSTPAAADECLLDTNDNGVADALDTDGGATSR